MCSSSRCYQDILAPRREEFSNFMWVSRQLRPQIAYQQVIKPTPQSHKDEVIKSAKIQEFLNTISQHESIAKEILEVQVRKILDEIGYNRKWKLLRWLALVLVKICNKIYSGIFINRDAIDAIKVQMGGCPVIFVPSHRSYADFILMSLVCFSEDIAIPAIAAGMDFHGMLGMGTVLRDTGAFFMRRTYNNDNIYWTTFKQYVYQIVTKGELAIEFFIEGTRSRSNKSLMPKYGLILMLLKAFFLSQVPDIVFVPINISYDRILEETLFAFELLGIPKPKESTSGFFKSLSIVKEKYGSIYFDMSRPISVKNYFGSNLDRSVHSMQPIHQQEITEEEKKLIPSLAHEIVYKQQKHCVITSFNLLAIILHNNLFSNNDFLNLDDFIKEMIWLRKIIESLGAFVQPGDMKRNVLEALEVHKNIVRLDEKQRITLVWNKIVLDKNNIGKLKAHALSENTITTSVPFIMLQLYINPVLHYLVDVALLVVILKQHNAAISKDELFGRYSFLRGLLSQEFVTFYTRETLEFEKALRNAINLDLITEVKTCYQIGEDKNCEEMMYNCICCFIFTYFMVCSTLLQSASSFVEERAIWITVQSEIEIRLHEENRNENKFVHPYSLNLDTISNCLNVLVSKKILKKSQNQNTVLYTINKTELLSVNNNLRVYVASEHGLPRKMRSVQFNLQNKL